MKTNQKTNGKVEILIAEDSPTQAAQLAHLLEQRAFTVMTAANGNEALALLERRKPTLVISDIVMPELDGYGLCRAMKADMKLKDIPVMLVTTLSDPQDVIRGLECGADNFLRKPYDERYLLSRIDYLLMNLELRKSQKMQMGMEIKLGGQKHFISSERQQILDLLISTYEQAVDINSELKQRDKELAHSNEVLSALYRIAEGLNQAGSEKEVVESVLERALELPGIQAGWIYLREGESGLRLAAARNLPPALAAPGAMEGECSCRRRLISGELDHVTNIMGCERLENAGGDTSGLRYHASAPLCLGDRTLGVISLVGPEKGLFSEDELKVLYGIGNQVAVALERAHLREHLEHMVQERTAALEAEIVERKRIEREQARLVAIIEATPDFIGTSDPDGNMLFLNHAGLGMLGYHAGADLTAVRMAEAHPKWAAKLVAERAIPHAVDHGSWSGETALLRRDGREVPVSQVVIAHKGSDGLVEYLSTIARDITLQKEHEKRITRLNRVYAVLSGINTLIVRVHNRDELFQEACRVAVAAGEFRMAWIGVVDRDAMKLVPVAAEGADPEFLEIAKDRFALAEGSPLGNTLAAQAIRAKKPLFSNDLQNDERIAFKERLVERGSRSIAMLPLLIDDEAVGVLALYAGETGFFDEQEMKLLKELAGDISFALNHIEKEEKLNYLAYYDELTGLANRSLFLERVAQYMRSAASGGHKLAVALIDLERFKNINDSLGRPAGDALLRQVAEWLTRTTGDASLLARVGADHFAGVLPEVKQGGDVARQLEKTMNAFVDHPFSLNDAVFRIAAKVGVALFPNDGADADTLFKNAEAALKKAKASGERYLFYTQGMSERVAEKLTLENQLRQALDNGEFVLHYQPKVNLASGKLTSAEALIRWNDPRTGLVPPGRFIPILEETGLIYEVGRWALRQAIEDYLRWRAAGLAAVRIAVNVSPRQLRHRSFITEIGQAIGVDAQAAAGLELELTESLIMEDVKHNIASLQAIRALGVTIAIDDFGTGFSSLSYLAKLPVDTLKIDRSFVIDMTSGPDGLALVSTIINLAHSLKLKVVAEGVETEEQSRLLRLLNCDEMQGYLFSKPVPVEIFETGYLAPPHAG